MARAKRKQDDEGVGGVIIEKDFDKAAKIIREDIKPARSSASEKMQEVSTAFKAIKKQCGLQPGAVKAAIKVAEMEDAKGEDWLRCFVGQVNKLIGRDVLTFHGGDLVDQAEGSADSKPKKPHLGLVTIPDEDADDDDFARAAGEEPTNLDLN